MGKRSTDGMIPPGLTKEAHAEAVKRAIAQLEPVLAQEPKVTTVVLGAWPEEPAEKPDFKRPTKKKPRR